MNWIREHFWILAILILSVALRISLGQDRDRWPLTTAEADWEREINRKYKMYGWVI